MDANKWESWPEASPTTEVPSIEDAAWELSSKPFPTPVPSCMVGADAWVEPWSMDKAIANGFEGANADAHGGVKPSSSKGQNSADVHGGVKPSSSKGQKGQKAKIDPKKAKMILPKAFLKMKEGKHLPSRKSMTPTEVMKTDNGLQAIRRLNNLSRLVTLLDDVSCSQLANPATEGPLTSLATAVSDFFAELVDIELDRTCELQMLE